jgi:hypothetical protein
MSKEIGRPRDRPRSFDERSKKPFVVFWTKGYDAVTIDDLVAGMGYASRHRMKSPALSPKTAYRLGRTTRPTESPPVRSSRPAITEMSVVLPAAPAWPNQKARAVPPQDRGRLDQGDSRAPRRRGDRHVSDEPPLRRGEADAFALEPALRCNQLLSQHLVFGDERQA